MFAIYDNSTSQRREMWVYGHVAAWVIKEVLADRLALPALSASNDPGHAAMATAGGWKADRIIGNVEHIPFPYRP